MASSDAPLSEQASLTRFERFKAYLSTPDDPALTEEHRRTVLLRTRAASLIAAVVIPFTILVYVNLFQPNELRRAVTVTAWSELGVFLIIILTRTELFARHFHIPFFLLVGVVCTVTEAIILQLTGGGAQSNFLFPYFAVLFGIATLFPSRFAWGMASSAMTPLSYIVSELWVRGEISEGPAMANLILLLDYAFIAAIANRVTTRLFFSEVEYRFKLEVANRQLREMDRAKSDFFANISHDLRSPLTVILGPLLTLSGDKDQLQPRHHHYLQLALGGAAKLDSMINDLLELARIDAGVGKLRPGRVDLRDMLNALLESSTPYAQSLGLRFGLSTPEHAVQAYLDGDKIERVLMNLVSNACKFSRSGTTITVELVELPDNQVQISVEDQGPGIAPEDQPRIFGRFARGKDASQKRTRGAGLGLAVVKEFVELHQGQVSVQSEVGKGSRFTVILPRGTEVEGQQPAPPERATIVRSRAPTRLLMTASSARAVRRTPPPNAPKLLIVEDTDDVRSFLESELSGDFHLSAAKGGTEGLSLAQTLRPDAIILDVMLPEMDGMEVCRRLRASESLARLPVLMYSARGDLQTRLDAFAAGTDDFMHKPFEPRELKARLHALLRRSGALARVEPSSPMTAAPPPRETGTHGA